MQIIGKEDFERTHSKYPKEDRVCIDANVKVANEYEKKDFYVMSGVDLKNFMVLIYIKPKAGTPADRKARKDINQFMFDIGPVKYRIINSGSVAPA